MATKYLLTEGANCSKLKPLSYYLKAKQQSLRNSNTNYTTIAQPLQRVN